MPLNRNLFQNTSLPFPLPLSHTTPLHWNTLSFEMNFDFFAIIWQTNPTQLDFIIIICLFVCLFVMLHEMWGPHRSNGYKIYTLMTPIWTLNVNWSEPGSNNQTRSNIERNACRFVLAWSHFQILTNRDPEKCRACRHLVCPRSL